METMKKAIEEVAAAICNGDIKRAEELIAYGYKISQMFNGKSGAEMCKQITFDPFFNNDLERVFTGYIMGEFISMSLLLGKYEITKP